MAHTHPKVELEDVLKVAGAEYSNRSGAECFEDNASAHEIQISKIVRDTQLQVRNRMDARLVNGYAKSMENAAKFPPIKLGLVDDRLVIVDGWHRVEAVRSLGLETVMALVKPVSQRGAMQSAALANLNHGKPLTRGEKREAFRLFIRGHGHRPKKGKYLSYREIAEALGGIGGHTTIRGWMEKDFPSIFRNMSAGEVTGYADAGPPPVDLDDSYRKQTLAALCDSLVFFKTLTPESRYECINEARTMLVEMSKYEARPSEF